MDNGERTMAGLWLFPGTVFMALEFDTSTRMIATSVVGK